MYQTSRSAFTLAEVLVAIVLVTMAFTSFYTYALLTLHRLNGITRESTAATLVNTRAEQFFSTSCAPTSGIDTLDAVTAQWFSSPISGSTAQLDLTTRYHTLRSSRIETYTTAGICR